MSGTELDRAHAAMMAAPGDDTARLAFHGRLSEGTLYVLLATEPQGDDLDPALFPVEGASYVLAFDREDRLAAFSGRPAPYAELPGRGLAALLAAQGLGLGLNLGAPSETLLAPDALVWLVETLGAETPARAEAVPLAFHPPGDLPDPLARALAATLARAAGLASGAWLAQVDYAGGERGHLLLIADAAPGAEDALARAVSEALTFSGIEAGRLDLAFRRSDDPVVTRIATVGRAFAIPAATSPAPAGAQPPPGSDPNRPPRLR